MGTARKYWTKGPFRVYAGGRRQKNVSQKPVGNSGKVTTTAGGNCLSGTTRKESIRMAVDGCGTHGSNKEKSDKCITTGVEAPFFLTLAAY